MLGSHLIAWRSNRGLSQAELAERAALPRPYLSRLERNAVDPSLSMLRRLAGALDIAVGQLVDTTPEIKVLDRFELDTLAQNLYRRDRRGRLGERSVRHLRAQVGEEQWKMLLSRLQKHRWQSGVALP